MKKLLNKFVLQGLQSELNSVKENSSKSDNKDQL